MSENNKINITSFYQSGGITAHTVNIGSQPRHINVELKSDLDAKLAGHKEKMITITSLLGDGEAISFAYEIGEYLKSKGYKVNGNNQAVWSNPVKGQGISFNDDSTVSIWVGSNTI